MNSHNSDPKFLKKFLNPACDLCQKLESHDLRVMKNQLLSSMLKKRLLTVRVELPGGLGNQIFAFAAGMVLSESLQRKLVLDSKAIDYSHATPDLDLRDLFNIEEFGFITSRDIPPYLRRLCDSLLFRLPALRYIYEKQSGIINEINIPVGESVSLFLFGHCEETSKRTLRLKGYYQDFSIVEKVKSRLKSKITVSYSSEGKALLRILVSSKILGVHVRGGDFLGPNWDNLVGNLSRDYYFKAISEAFLLMKFDAVWVFTNDLHYAKSLFGGFPYVVRFIDQNTIEKPSENFNLLRMCRGLITSNSSFSLMASYLAENAQVVIVPEHFSKARNILGGMPSEWIKMKSIWM